MSSTRNQTDFIEILKVLTQHKVDFIVVGGVSAVLQGAPISTFDLDIVHSRTPENIDRLLAALQELESVYRGQPGRIIKPDKEALSGSGHSLFMTRSGPLDVLGTIGNKRDYENLSDHTISLDIDESLVILLLKLATLIQTKKESNRPQDRAILGVLRTVLEEVERAEDEGKEK